MKRERKLTKAIEEAQGFTERIGYQLIVNPRENLAFDLLIFKPESIRVVKVRQTRYHIDPNGFYDQQFPDEITALRSLQFPKFILRELWLRTQHERVWRRLVVHEFGVEEIEWWGPDGYTNPHVRHR